jgi:hypothetical protein
MGTVNKKGKSFFEIAPQEVRDLIYDATFHHEAKRGHVTSNFDAPCLHLRLVSRQFKDEYDKQTPKRTKLVLCFDAEIVLLALATALKAPSTSNYSTAVWRALVRLAAWTPMFPGLSYLKSPPS